MTECVPFPSAVGARAALDGEPGALADLGGMVAMRAALLAAGMAAAGERQNLGRNALAGSLAVQAFVVSYTASRRPSACPTLPSAEAATQGFGPILVTYLLRSSMVASGLFLAGERKNVVRNALAGTAAIELAVIAWTMRETK